MPDKRKQLTLSDDFLRLREHRELVAFAARSDRSRGRRHEEKEHPYRSAYMRDRDRIIHCTAFRRLEYKTQVFVNHEGDYYRTRLTHTMEVAQIARIIARILRLNEDLTEAVALAHDIGHTPFGHAGEEALDKLMQGEGGFEHNVHGLRVVDVLERRYPDFPGLNLTYEVRESIVKHHTAYDQPALPGEFDLSERPLAEAQIVEVADAIAYDSHDIDDGLKSGLIEEKELDDVALWRVAKKAVVDRYGEMPEDVRRVQVVKHMINAEVTDVLEATELRINWLKLKDADGVRALEENLVTFSEKLKPQKKELERFLTEKLYRHPRVVKMTTKARRFLEAIFSSYVADVRQLPLEYQQRVDGEERRLLEQSTAPAPPDSAGHERLRASAVKRIVCDYVSGMTDRYAQEDYTKLFMPNERI